MKTQTLLLAFGLMFNIAFAQQKDDAQLTAHFDKMLSKQFKNNETGAAVLVSRNGEIIYHKGFGMANLELNVPMQSDNVFRIASITKQFTAIAILQLMEQGKLNLQDDLTKFIPDYPTQGNTITIEHLLTHTSGIANDSDMPDHMIRIDMKPIELIDHFKNRPMKFAPGSKYGYSNNGYVLLGHIIEKISGKTYTEYLQQQFFTPLGMTNSLYANDIKIVNNRAAGYSHGENGFENAQPISMTHPYAAGAIESTVADLFKWHQAVNTYKLVKKETLAKAFSRYKLTDGKESDYGYGWRMGNVYDSPSIWHAGLINGFMTWEIYLPKDDVFVAVFTNCECNSPEVVTAALAALAGGKSFEHNEIAVENRILNSYTGVYENQKGQQRIITVIENGLHSQIGRGPKSLLKAYGKDAFVFAEDKMIEIVFSRKKNGHIDKLTAQKLSGNEVWTKTGLPLPDENGIPVDGRLLDQYVGQYEITPDFIFTIVKENDRLALLAPGQEKMPMFAETQSKFFLKVNDAEFEFVKDQSGNVSKVILNQGGRKADAKKVK